MPTHVLHLIANTLRSQNEKVETQLVDCTKVPVLTVFSADRSLSLDLTVNEAIGEFHVLWFQSQQASSMPSPVLTVPFPSPDGWSQGLEVAALRCVKWWLRRRRIPLPKEGGYPSIVWTLMVLHVLRCSIFVRASESDLARGGALLRAVAAFFDRFAEGGLAGTFLFTACAGAEFRPHVAACQDGECVQAMPASEFSVLDPTTTDEVSAACGVEPAELAPQTSMASQLLYAYEFRRAQALSAIALMSGDHTREDSPDEQIKSPLASCGSDALRELFADVDDTVNSMPTKVPAGLSGVFALQENRLRMGILQRINPKPGWQASFLHRRDAHSSFALRLCTINADSGTATRLDSTGKFEWFHPCDFVCMVALQADVHGDVKLDAEGLHRWQQMHALLGTEPHDESHWNDLETESCASWKRHRGSKRRQHGRQMWRSGRA